MCGRSSRCAYTHGQSFVTAEPLRILLVDDQRFLHQRRQQVDFAGPYFIAGQDLLVRADNTDITGAEFGKAALDRIVIPQDALNRIAGIAPRSSLIVTDEALSPETGKGTEFVVLLSGEPQGGIKKRRRSPGSDFRYAFPRSQPFGRSPFGSSFFNW